jgi:hypothetical protein
VLDIPMAQVSLQGSGVVPLVGERVAAGMAQHVRMGLEAETRLDPSPFDHAGKANGAEGRSALRREHEGRLRLLLALHRGIPHDLLNACLIHRELRQMLFGCYMSRRH